MRRLVLGFAVAAITAMSATLATADDGQIAQKIANELHQSGKFQGAPIAVKFEEGTVWLKGELRDNRQIEQALTVVMKRQEVQNVVNWLKVASEKPAADDSAEPVEPAKSEDSAESQDADNLEQPAKPAKRAQANLASALDKPGNKVQLATANESVELTDKPEREAVAAPSQPTLAVDSAPVLQASAEKSNDLQATQATQSDSRKRAISIAKQLRSTPGLENLRILVKYEEGTAWLRGQVDSPQLAQKLISTVNGREDVQQVISELTVDYTQKTESLLSQPKSRPKPQAKPQPKKPTHRLTSSTSATANQQRAMNIAQQLQTTRGLEKYRIGVKYERGVVWLKGDVDYAEQARFAVELVKSRTDVQHVVNELRARQSRIRPTGYQQGAGANQQAAGGQRSPLASGARAVGTAAVLPVAAAAGAAQGLGRMARPVNHAQPGAAPTPARVASTGMGATPMSYDQPHLPNHAWPSYAAYPNYAGLTYPRQYSPTAWPYIGPFYPYPQVPLGWRKVQLEWNDGWWWLDFKN